MIALSGTLRLGNSLYTLATQMALCETPRSHEATTVHRVRLQYVVRSQPHPSREVPVADSLSLEHRSTLRIPARSSRSVDDSQIPVTFETNQYLGCTFAFRFGFDRLGLHWDGCQRGPGSDQKQRGK